MNDSRRDCTHPAFPLRHRRRQRNGKCADEWTWKPRGERIAFGSVANDPRGEVAWRLYELEHNAWLVNQNPRAGLGRMPREAGIDLTWVREETLASVGVSLIDPTRGILGCIYCCSKWIVPRCKGTRIEKRLLQCPINCLAAPPAQPSNYELALKKKHREALRLAPDEIDLRAECEGTAIAKLAALAVRPQTGRPAAMRLRVARELGRKGRKPREHV